MDHSFEYSHEYDDDSFAIVSASNIGVASGSGSRSTDPNACNQSIIVDNSEKSCKDFRVHEWIHLVISLLNNCAYLTLAGYLMYKYMSDSDHYVISTVIIVKFVFCNYFLFHGVFREQPFQIIMQTMTVFSMWTVDLIYTMFSLVHPPDRLADIRMDPEMILFYVRTTATGINLLTGIAVAWKYFSLEQAIFKTVGTDMNRVSIFRSLFFGFSLMVFDMEISLSSLLLFLRNGFSNIVVHEIAILSAGSVFIIMWIYLGYTAVRKESHALTYTFYCVSVLQPVYILCLFYRDAGVMMMMRVNIKRKVATIYILSINHISVQSAMDRKKSKEWGSDLIRTRISRETYVPQERTWRDLKFWEWIFIIFALLSISISIGFSVFQLVIALIAKEKYIFPVLVILNNIFSAYFLWNGVMEELPFKLLIQLIIKTAIWIFDLIYFLVPNNEDGKEEEEEGDPYKEIREIRFYISSSMLFLTLITGTVVIYQYWTSNIAIFRTVGTEPKYVQLCKLWNLCHSMMLFDAVVFITVVFHLCNFPAFLETYASFYLIPLWLLVTVMYVLLGIKAIERESRMLTYVFYVASHFQPIFVIYMLVKSTRSSLGLLLYISLFFTAGLSFLTHISLLVTVVRLQLSYGMGLKQAAAREEERKNLVTIVEGNRSNGELTKFGVNSTQPPPTETEL